MPLSGVAWRTHSNPYTTWLLSNQLVPFGQEGRYAGARGRSRVLGCLGAADMSGFCIMFQHPQVCHYLCAVMHVCCAQPRRWLAFAGTYVLPFVYQLLLYKHERVDACQGCVGCVQ